MLKLFSVGVKIPMNNFWSVWTGLISGSLAACWLLLSEVEAIASEGSRRCPWWPNSDPGKPVRSFLDASEEAPYILHLCVCSGPCTWRHQLPCGSVERNRSHKCNFKSGGSNRL